MRWYGLIDRALGEFHTMRPRSKHIQVPISRLEAQADPAPAPQPAGARPQPDPAGVDQVAKMLARARRPMFIFGGGAVQGAKAARRIVAQSEAASFTTYAGRGIIAPDAPLHYGAYLAQPESAAEIAQADLVIAIGTELAEGEWTLTRPSCATGRGRRCRCYRMRPPSCPRWRLR